MKRLIISIAFMFLALASSIAAETPSPASAAIGPLGPAGAPASAFPKPRRPVAPIVSDKFSTEEARDQNGEAVQVMRLLGVRPGMTIADLGAGEGYYTVRLARQIGPTGHVIAEDVVAEYLEKLRQRLAREQLSNVSLDLGEPHDPRLPPRSVDLVLMVHMYHEIEQPYGLLYNLFPALRDGARIAIIDLDRPTELHGTPREVLLCELQAVGFRLINWGWLRKNLDYLVLFEPPVQPIPPQQIKSCKR